MGAYDSPSVSHDPIAKRLVTPGWSAVLRAAENHPRIARRAMGIATLVTGGLARHLPFRTRAIDDALGEAIAEGTRQIVLLGAGLDARAYRLPSLAECTVFEVDHPDTQTHKREAVSDVPVLAREIRYVTVNFEKNELESALDAAGYDRTKRSAIVWEGVTMYLEPPAIEGTLRVIARVLAPGSTLMVTYQDTLRPPLWPVVRPLFVLVGEPLRTSFAKDDMRALLEKHGFEVTTDEGDPEWSERFFAKKPALSVSERLACARFIRLLG
jgi:methyltransferase (TIGR00027 family)